jgi:hypothetical protein
VPEALNCQQGMAKTTQVLSNLNENFFDFLDFVVKQFCGSSVALQGGEVHKILHVSTVTIVYEY